VSASGLIGVCYQQVSAGRHLAGQVVTVRLHPTVLQVFFAGQLIRTVHAAAPRRWSSSAPTDPIDPNHDPQPPRDVSTITRNQTRKHQPELDTPSPPSHHEHQPEQGHRAAQGAGGLVPPGRLEVLPVAQLGHPDRGPAQGAGTQRPLAPSRGWRGARLRRITGPPSLRGRPTLGGAGAGGW